MSRNVLPVKLIWSVIVTEPPQSSWRNKLWNISRTSKDNRQTRTRFSRRCTNGRSPGIQHLSGFLCSAGRRTCGYLRVRNACYKCFIGWKPIGRSKSSNGQVTAQLRELVQCATVAEFRFGAHGAGLVDAERESARVGVKESQPGRAFGLKFGWRPLREGRLPLNREPRSRLSGWRRRPKPVPGYSTIVDCWKAPGRFPHGHNFQSMVCRAT